MLEAEPIYSSLLRAVADGKTLQEYVYISGMFVDRPATYFFKTLSVNPTAFSQWRVKPTRAPDVVKRLFIELEPSLDNAHNKPNVEFTFDGETKSLKKAEVLHVV
jgi:hypothetical protein